MSEFSYPNGFYFELSLRGEKAVFQEVSGLSSSLEIEEEAPGAENRFKYKLPTAPKYSNLVLKRGMVPSSSKLCQWFADCIVGGPSKPIITEDVTVSLLTVNGDKGAKWLFYNAYPINYSISGFRSQQNEVVIESIELAYNYFAKKT